MTGCIAALAVISMWHIGKAVLDAFCFKDREGAKHSLFLWLVSTGSIGLALGFSLLIDYLG